LVACGRLSWLLVSFWAHVDIVHRIVSYCITDPPAGSQRGRFTTEARVPVVTLGLCRSVERLSASDVKIDDGCSMALCKDGCMYYAIISGTNLHCSHLAAL